MEEKLGAIFPPLKKLEWQGIMLICQSCLVDRLLYNNIKGKRGYARIDYQTGVSIFVTFDGRL